MTLLPPQPAAVDRALASRGFKVLASGAAGGALKFYAYTQVR
jgi:hypothetical protein